MILNRRALIHAKRPHNYTRVIREICWVCNGMGGVAVPNRDVELGVTREPCMNCAARGYLVRQA